MNKKAVMFLLGASISWHELAHATPPGFEPVPLKEVGVSVLLDDVTKKARTIYIRINKEKKLNVVCIDKVCNDILSEFPVVKDIYNIYIDSLIVLKEMQDSNKSGIRLVLKFKEIRNKKCSAKNLHREDNAIALTFDQFGKIRSVAVICGFDGLYYEPRE